MLQYMGRENSEDYGTSFTILLNTWESAVKYLRLTKNTEPRAIEVATILGWTFVRSDKAQDAGQVDMTASAKACNKAFQLLESGRIQRQTYAGMAPTNAVDLTGPATRAIKGLENIQKHTPPSSRNAAVLEQRKKQVESAVEKTAEKFRQGKIAPGGLRQATEEAINFEVGRGEKVKVSPLFSQFCYTTGGDIGRVLKHDLLGEQVERTIGIIPHLTLPADEAAANYMAGTLGELSDRAKELQTRLTKALDVLEVGTKTVRPVLSIAAKRGE
jgi:hypothetical protein